MSKYNIYTDECRYLVLKIIEQAIRDYLLFENSPSRAERNHYTTAMDFLFDDEYHIWYGEKEVNLIILLSWLGLDPDWFRRRVREAKQNKTRKVRLRGVIRKRTRSSDVDR